MPEPDPLAVIAAPPPDIPDGLAIATLRERYGLAATVKPLVSERDQNFLCTAAGGRRYVLKIANAAEDPVVTDFQIEALLHIEAAVEAEGIPVTTPRVVRTVDGAARTRIEATGGTLLARLVTFVEGIPLGERVASAALAREMGAFLAHLGRALRGFSHAGARQPLLWDLQQAHRLRELIRHVRGEAAQRTVSEALDDFERHAAPQLGALRSQVIHNDFNADNVVIDADDPDSVAGVIDFGDMLEAPLVADVAIGASYVRVREGDPLALMAEFVAAYHAVTPLERPEIDVLFDLIQARMSASVAILDWRESLRGADDPYLKKFVREEVAASRVLSRLREVPRDNAIRLFRSVCAAADVRRGQSSR